jgi:hypothetical protein
VKRRGSGSPNRRGRGVDEHGMSDDGASSWSETERLAALPVPELARAWAAAARTGAAVGGRRQEMYEATSLMLRTDPFKGLALVREIVTFETDDEVLAYLAAGLLEDVLPAQEGPLLDAVIAAIDADARFADLFFDIHFNGLEAVADRIVAAVRAKVGAGG